MTFIVSVLSVIPKSHTYNRVSYGRQMQIKWKMASPIPASVMQYAKLSNVI